MSAPNDPPRPRADGLSRRGFLGLAAGAGLGAAVPIWAGLPTASAASSAGFPEATIEGLARAMRSGKASSADITAWYLRQIKERNGLLNAVLETNPDVMRIARARDRERRGGQVRGPLHGVPILLKDNLATDDDMETTAGSLALLGAQVPRDALVVAKLRKAGAVILGKANLSEWANFRGGSLLFPTIDGWSARGGFTHNPYRLDATAGGSSSGSAVAVAADLTALAVGTDTTGSITFPAGVTNTVGLRPTVGLVSQQGIIPIAASYDTAGPMTRTVTDAAILLSVLRSPFPVPGMPAARELPTDYRRFLRPGALRGVRIGVDPQLSEPGPFETADATLFDLADALGALKEAGATLVEVEAPELDEAGSALFSVFESEFKPQLNAYLRGLRRTKMRNLADLIDFNRKRCAEELTYFGQEIFESAQEIFESAQESAGVGSRDYRAALRQSTRAGKAIAALFESKRLGAIAGPSASFAFTVAGVVAGGPHLSVPAGFDPTGRPKGLSLLAPPFQEGPLLGYGFAFEQVTRARRTPTFGGAVADRAPLHPGCALAAAPIELPVAQRASAQPPFTMMGRLT